MTNNDVPPPRSPIADANGMVTGEWYRWFNAKGVEIDEAGTGEVVGTGGLTGGGTVADGVTLSLAPNGVTNDKIRQSAGRSVIGRQVASSGNVSDITATSDGRTLSRQNGILDFYDYVRTRAVVAGAHAVGLVEVDADYTVANNVTIVIVDATAGPVMVTLPDVADQKGRDVTVKKIDASANDVTIDGDANIDGAATLVISTQYDAYTVMSGETQWWIA